MSIIWFVATLMSLFYLEQKLPGVGQDGWNGNCNADPAFSRNVDEKLKAVLMRIQSPEEQNSATTGLIYPWTSHQGPMRLLNV